MATFITESSSVCGPKVEPRLPPGRLRSSSQSVPILTKKKDFWRSGSFFPFFGQLSTFTSFSLVSLTLALHAPNLAYAFSMSSPLDPCLHLHQPRCTYGAAPPQTNVLCLLSLLFQAAAAKETLPVSGLCAASVGRGTPTCPKLALLHFPFFCLLTSLSYFLAFISRLVKTTSIFVVRT